MERCKENPKISIGNKISHSYI